MAATGKTPILLYGSTTATNAPVAANLTNSSDGCEVAINVADKNLFFKDSTNAVNTVPIRQSSASSNGWLSSTDWSTFNSKVSSQWVTTGSNIYYNSGNVAIGTTSPNVNSNRNTLTLQGAWGGEVDITVGATTHARFGTDNFDTGYSCRVESQDSIILKTGTSSNVIVNTGNLVIGTSGKGITTGSAIPLGLGTNNGVSSATIHNSGGVSIGNTTDPGATNLSVTGKSETNNVTTQRVFKTSVAAGGTAVVTINPVNTISSHTQVSVMLNAAYTASTNLQYHAGYVQLTCNSGTGGGGTAIAEYYNGSAGNFSVATGNFVVTRSGSGVIVITYTNANGGGAANNVEFSITGLFSSATIA